MGWSWRGWRGLEGAGGGWRGWLAGGAAARAGGVGEARWAGGTGRTGVAGGTWRLKGRLEGLAGGAGWRGWLEGSAGAGGVGGAGGEGLEGLCFNPSSPLPYPSPIFHLTSQSATPRTASHLQPAPRPHHPQQAPLQQFTTPTPLAPNPSCPSTPNYQPEVIIIMMTSTSPS